MAPLQLIGGPRSNFVWTTRIVLAEKGVPYENLPVPPHTPEVTAIHPYGKIPALRHGDFTLCESRAICGYIDSSFPGPSLLPADAKARAKVEQWVSILCTIIDPVFIRQYVAAYIFPGTADGSPNRAAIEKALPLVEKHLATLERNVGTYLTGEEFTLADAYLYPMLKYLSQFPATLKLLRGMPKLTAYLARLDARPSTRDTTPPPPSEAELAGLRKIAAAARAGASAA